MHAAYATPGDAAPAIPIWFATAATYAEVRERLDAHARAFAEASGFEPKAGRHVLLPDTEGNLSAVLFGLDAEDKPWERFAPGRMPGVLPAGTYRFANTPHDARLAALAFALGSYAVGRYRKVQDKAVRLALPDGEDGADLFRIVEAV